MITKHTPGPWKIASWLSSKANIRANDGHGNVATVHVRYTKTDNLSEHAANARLIAAAPELLEALQNLLRYPSERPPGSWEAASLAVAKATGGAP